MSLLYMISKNSSIIFTPAPDAAIRQNEQSLREHICIYVYSGSESRPANGSKSRAVSVVHTSGGTIQRNVGALLVQVFGRTKYLVPPA